MIIGSSPARKVRTALSRVGGDNHEYPKERWAVDDDDDDGDDRRSLEVAATVATGAATGTCRRPPWWR